MFRLLQEDDEDSEEEILQVQAVTKIEDKQDEEWRVDEVHHVRAVSKKDEWLNLGVGDIVIDSAADESCWPVGQGDAFATKPSRKRIDLRTANGGQMEHCGQKEVTFMHEGDRTRWD